jgi:phosphoglycerate dehydrogenase-like enzyme
MAGPVSEDALFLYVAPSPVEPALGEFNRAMGARSYRRFDPGKDIASQFEGITTVVDIGGWGRKEHIDAALSGGVRLWQVFGYGLDHLDVRRLLLGGMRVAHTPGGCSASALAEHALLLMLSCTRHLKEQFQNLAHGLLYEPWTSELGGKTLLILGLGASGRELARRAMAFDMSIVAVDEVIPDDATIAKLGIERMVSPTELAGVLRDADVVSLHLPLTTKTRHIIDASAIAQFKTGAGLVNVARGALVDERALYNALDQGAIGFAGLDVFESEPPPEQLWSHPRVIATPHTAGATQETARRRAESVVANILRMRAGEEPFDCVGLGDGFVPS